MEVIQETTIPLQSIWKLNKKGNLIEKEIE